MSGLKFALLARTSTDDLQNPHDSLAWQRARAEQIIAGHGSIVTTFHDIGVSRSFPWRRREQAAQLLAEVRAASGRRFDAIVVGELARAFGNPDQASPVLPVLGHFGVQFWSPEFAGAYDPANEAHDVLLGAFTGLSKGERTRIKVRVSAAMTEQARSGRFLGGRPPYGYQIGDAGPHPNPSKAAAGQRLHRLEPDPNTAPVVRRIFLMYVHESMGCRAIAQRLTDDRIPSPSAYDAARNRHRQGNGGAWSRGAIVSILNNPRYTGHEVWAKAKGTERLIDVDDVGLGSAKVSRIQDRSNWVLSDSQVHEPIIDPDLFAKSQAIGGLGRARRADRRPNNVRRTYVLRGRVRCAACGRKMEGDHADGHNRYRCRLTTAEYARNAELDRTHPKNAAVREARITGAIDGWLNELFDADHIDQTVAALTQAASEPDPVTEQRRRIAQARVEDCDTRLRRFRAALNDENAAVVGGWIAEAMQEREAAARDLADCEPVEAMTEAEVMAVAEWFAQQADRLAAVLRSADPVAKQQLYASLGIMAYFTPGEDMIEVTAMPTGGFAGVGGGT